MTKQNEFRPAVVLVGASRGIGRAIAKVAARESAVIVLVARSLDELVAAATDVRAAGAETFTLDLELVAVDAPSVSSIFSALAAWFCDVLVNRAGYGLRPGDCASCRRSARDY